MAARNILEERPTLDELCENVQITTKWYQFGVLLKLDAKKLSDIEQSNKDADFKTLQMFKLWLDTSTNATRSQILETLRKDAIKEIAVADKYDKKLNDDIAREYICDVICTCIYIYKIFVKDFCKLFCTLILILY